MPNDKAIFYYRSYCDIDVDGYTVSGDYVSTDNAIDHNKRTFSETSGLDTDGDSADFEIDLSFDRNVSAIALKSNLKTFTIYAWEDESTGATGGGMYEVLQSYASNTDEFLIYDFTQIQTSKIKITATHTITADEEKRIYLMEITDKITEMEIENIEQSEKMEQSNHNNIYGGSIQTIKYPNYPKIEIDLSWENLTGTQYTAYETMKAIRKIDSFNVYLYFSDTFEFLGVDAYYLVNDTSDYKSDPSSPALSAGIAGEMDLKEV